MRRRTACTKSAAWAPSAGCRTSTTWCFLGASLSRYPLEGYREKCSTRTVLGTRFAKKPIELDIPITIAGMSFGSLSANVKEALGRAATEVGTSTTTGDGGMTPEERQSSKTLVYQCLPSRYGFNPDDVRRADAIEMVIGQGAKPGGGGMLLGQKVSPRVAGMRTLPAGIDQRSACRHPDWTGPDDLAIKILEMRELTDWEKPIYVKVGATRTFNDVKLAVHSGADVVVVDGMQGGTAATQTCFIEHVGIPTLAAVRQAVDALEDLDMKGKVQLIVSGGIRSGPDVAKALAMGADAVSIGQGVLIALGCNHDSYFQGGAHHDATADYAAIGTAPGYCHHCHTGQVPGRHHHPGCGAGTAPHPRGRRPPPEELPEDAQHGTDHHRARLRQAERASPRAGGPGRADHRGRGDGARAARRNQLDPRRQRLVASRAQPPPPWRRPLLLHVYD
jgi:methylamine---glutamate N-methyltransferase subunit C